MQRRRNRRKGRETDAVIPGLRLTKEFGNYERKEGVTWVSALDIDGAYGEGKAHFDIPAGQIVRFDSGSAIPGPATVDTEFELSAVQFSARGGLLASGIVSLQGIVGVGGHHSKFRVEGPTGSDSQRIYSFGPHIGARFGIRPCEWAELYGQVRAGGGVGESGYEVDVRDFEAALRVLPTENIGIVGGWRWLRYEADGHDGDSDIEMKLSGPMVMLQIVF